MDKPKTKLVKSKSSNDALTKNGSQKKSKSLEVHTKKEGKDEKKGTKVLPGGTSMSSKGSGTKVEQIKPPPRPRPGQKRFLASVLSILSKSTTGTQYPDSEDLKGKRKHKEKKFKYRSKVLNDLEDQVDFDVIQHKKEIVQTPSVYSENSNQEFKPWELGLPRLVKPDEEELRMKREQNINILVKEVAEGRMEKEKVNQEPDKGLYNFFVDLLETTFSVYNVKTDINRSGSNLSSKVAFEIDENVAKKLKVSPNIPEDLPQKPSKKFDVPNNVREWKPDPVIDFFQSSPSSIRSQEPKKKRIKSRSFDYVKENRRPNQGKASRRKSFDRHTKKENLLNLLKEQLTMDFNPFDEPPNLYQSLQIMAKNKRKNQKTLRFEKSKYDDYTELIKRRRTKDERTSEYTKKKSQDETSEEDLSNHSLEVYGFDYEHPYIMKPEKRERNFLFTYHSSPSESDVDFEPYESMLHYSKTDV